MWSIFTIILKEVWATAKLFSSLRKTASSHELPSLSFVPTLVTTFGGMCTAYMFFFLLYSSSQIHREYRVFPTYKGKPAARLTLGRENGYIQKSSHFVFNEILFLRIFCFSKSLKNDQNIIHMNQNLHVFVLNLLRRSV